MAWNPIANVKGPQGVKGDTGATGGVGAQGVKGDTGATGNTGPAGPGLPTGGTAGQYPRKASGTNYDTAWTTIPATDVVKSVITAAPTGSYTVNASLGSDWYITATADRVLTISGGADGQMVLVDVLASGAQRVITISGATLTTGMSATLTIPSGKVGTIGYRRTNGVWRVLAQTVDV